MPKLKRLQPDSDQRDECLYRIAAVQPETANEAERSIDLVLATETPVPVFDFSRMDVVDEVIEMAGVEVPAQVPLVDSHDRYSVRNVLGSIRDLRVESGQLLGRAYFSGNPEAQKVFDLYREGHLTDFSVGAKRIEVKYDGDTRRIVRSRPIEGSAVAVGADPNARVLSVSQRAYFEPAELKGEAMENLIDSLRAEFDIPEDVKPDAIPKWLKDNQAAERNAADTEPETAQEKETPEMAPHVEPKALDRAEIRKQELQRIKQVQTICRNAGLAADEVERYLDSDKTANEIAGEILSRELQVTSGAEPTERGVAVDGDRIDHGDSQADKFYRAVGDALTLRCLGNVAYDPERTLQRHRGGFDRDTVQRATEYKGLMNRQSPGADVFRYASLSDIAAACLREHGVRGLERMPRHELVRRAFRMEPLTRSSGAIHSTGSFSNLLLDASNKTLLMGYDEQMTTYQMWVRQAASATDFKTLNRIRFGELPDPEEVPENFPYPDKTVSDNKESYSVRKYGEIFSITLEAVINDDLDAISRIPAMHGAAHRRKVNKEVYSILTTNPNLSDSIALFHATSHGANLDSNTLTVANLNTGYTVMKTQTGLSGSGTILNIMPRFLIVPAALEATALQIVNSTANPDNAAGSTEDATRPNFNSGTANIYGPGGPRQVMVVADGQLDGSTSQAWWLAADPRQVDTIEITFLQGEESPVLDREEGFEVDAIRFKSRQTFATKAIDYRGLYQGNSLT